MKSDLIVLQQVGGTDLSAPDTISQSVFNETDGWDSFFKRFAAPAFDAGASRFMVWDPLGHQPSQNLFLTGSPGQFDNRIRKLAQSAVPYISAGKEVFVYLGSPVKDRVLETWKSLEWIRYFAWVIAPVVEAGVKIVFDNMFDGVSQGDKYETAIRLFRNLGADVRVEPRCWIPGPGERGSDLIDVPGATLASLLEYFSDRKYTTESDRGEQIEHISMLLGVPPKSFGWGNKTTLRSGAEWNAQIPGWCDRSYRLGYTPCFTLNSTVRAGGVSAVRDFLNRCRAERQ